MGLEPSTRPWLFARMIGSFAIMSIVALTIGLLAAAVIGTAIYLAITVAFAVVRGYVLSFGGGVPGGELWGLWVSNAGPIAMVIGIVSLPLFYRDPIRAEIRRFNAEIGTTGTLATERHPEIATMARRLSQQADISEPEVRIVNRRRPESYALGGRSNGTIVITRGVVRALEDEEIEAVLAHEVSHLANGDGRLVTLLLVPMLVAEHLGSRERPAFQFFHGLGVFAYVAHVVVWTVLTAVTTAQLLLCQLGVGFLSRGREFAADRAAAELTGSPGALASALETLHDARGRPDEDLRDFRRSAGALDILPPDEKRRASDLFRTHPTTERRIAALRSMAGSETY
ncbi:M48 family metalloprotease [Natrialba sp. INN-245]|uniref:M48 family metallopeptidase n=1 Tax=Natrialba sp. INN-245 TaxID=2690967 RepID=UPI0013128B1A|nr:M48 family metalloprotease [Natrialba sp. INN-245]MWV38363.1 M48 family metalloprotease [Natrialba sp. INN-245]